MLTTVLTAIGDVPVDTSRIAAQNQQAAGVQNAAATLTAANLLNGLIQTTPVAGINLQLPTAASLDAAEAQTNKGNAVPAGYSFEFSVINTSAGAFAATLTTNTGWTLVGSMAVGQNVSGRFKASKTAAGAWTLYRIS